MIKYISLFLFILTLISCGNNGIKITDYYRVYDYVDFDYNGNPVKAKNTLKCKLASKNDPFIEDVINIKWNDSTIITKTNKGYFIIESNPSFGLCCGCSNKTIGPFNNKELKVYRDKIGFEPKNEIEIK